MGNFLITLYYSICHIKLGNIKRVVYFTDIFHRDFGFHYNFPYFSDENTFSHKKIIINEIFDDDN